LTSTSLPVGNTTRRLVPLAASDNAIVTATATSRPLGGGPKSSGSN
jgi:hypothetical protein